MKQIKCPNGKHGGCWDYGSCEDCPIGIMIERYEKKVKRLKAEIEYKTEAIRNAVKISEEGEKELVKIRKETAKEILNAVDNESTGQTISITNYLRKKFGVEVEDVKD